MANYFKLGYYGFKYLLFGMKFPGAISIDVTNRCNLNCKHCYFKKQNHTEELTKEELLKRIKEIKRKYPSIIYATWIGGEPLLRKDVIKEGMKLFPFNAIMTNGTIELPKWKNCVFLISVDGTKNYYEKIRGVGVYDKVKKHANRNDIKVNITCVLNKQNHSCIEDMLKEWEKTKVGGISFNFYTPIKGIKEDLWISWKERDKIIEKLLELKKQYGDFILNSEPELELMLSKNSRKITENCLLPKVGICLDPMGKRKLPCAIGDKADCSRCGCIYPFFLEAGYVRKQIKPFSTLIKRGG